MIQGSDEWLIDRLGYVTASCFADILSKGQGITRLKYMRRVVAERLTGKPIESYFNADMARGQEQEDFARLEYESRTGNLVEEVGFIKHASLLAGASPDGIIEANGGLEIKSVIPTVQIETIDRGGFPACHAPQIMGSLWITGREWWDFVSYSPDLPKPLRLYVFRVHRNEEYIKNLETEVIRFLDEAEKMQQRLLRFAA